VAHNFCGKHEISFRLLWDNILQQGSIQDLKPWVIGLRDGHDKTSDHPTPGPGHSYMVDEQTQASFSEDGPIFLIYLLHWFRR
jgi:hypothetical protein